MLNELKVVITRPEKQGLELKQALDKVGIPSICQPLFTYQPNTDENNIQQQVEAFIPSIIIFISVAAVEFSHKALPLEQWINSEQQVIAVGETTQHALSKLGIQAICPTTHDSEGILALTQLKKSQLENTNILIVRGDGGREFLAEQLTSRGAKVKYLESYSRQWLPLSPEQTVLWQNKKVNTIVITSNALLKRVVNLINITDNYWQNTCLWLVASERIAQSALQLGLQNVVNTHGANNQSIITTLLNMESKND
ncbi:MAG: uroporphyrinogen-III synthase [Colwelliaceae bacterium]|jgi:uroporphyrinogen-III synthase|nr:uroporphyrinogen-III synthase [Colwelliaceae bacterium]